MKKQMYITILFLSFFLCSCNIEKKEETEKKVATDTVPETKDNVRLEDKESTTVLEQLQNDPINIAIDKQDNSFPTTEAGKEITGKKLHLYTDSNTMMYNLALSKSNGLSEFDQISNEERESLEQKFDPHFNAFWEVFQKAKLKKTKEIYLDTELKENVNQNEKYVFLQFQTTDGISKFETEIAVGNNGTVLYKHNNFQRPSKMLGESGVYTTDSSLFRDLLNQFDQVNKAQEEERKKRAQEKEAKEKAEKEKADKENNENKKTKKSENSNDKKPKN